MDLHAAEALVAEHEAERVTTAHAQGPWLHWTCMDGSRPVGRLGVDDPQPPTEAHDPH
jgi:hypothetical protein